MNVIKINNYKFNFASSYICIIYPILLKISFSRRRLLQHFAEQFCSASISGGDFRSKLRRSLSYCWIFSESFRSGTRDERFLTILPDRKMSAESLVVTQFAQSGCTYVRDCKTKGKPIVLQRFVCISLHFYAATDRPSLVYSLRKLSSLSVYRIKIHPKVTRICIFQRLDPIAFDVE